MMTKFSTKNLSGSGQEDAAPLTRTVVVTYLEMLSAPPRSHMPLPPGLRVTEAVDPQPHFYRQLYDAVGRPYSWRERLDEEDAVLRAAITPPTGRAYIAYWHERPAGLAELKLGTEDGVQLNYFGLIPELVGLGLGRHFLRSVIDLVWESRPGRFWLHTCSTDSKYALPCYERAGFVRFDQKSFLETVSQPAT